MASPETSSAKSNSSGATSRADPEKIPMSAAPNPQANAEPERFTGHKIRLAAFEGPLDLLLYLIRAHRADIFDIPIRQITSQFIEYLALMREVEVEIAGDFLVTAATLMQIKARMLLPKTQSQSEGEMEGDEADPRAELVERLLEYQQIREAAETLREKREERADLFARPPEWAKNQVNFGDEIGEGYDAELANALLLAEVSSFDLLSALRRVLKRVEERPVALVRREAFTLPDRLRGIAARLYHTGELSFEALCDDCQSRLEVVVTFLAILELIRRGRARVRQLTLFDEIWLELS